MLLNPYHPLSLSNLINHARLLLGDFLLPLKIFRIASQLTIYRVNLDD
ncbi:hypothetical protein NEOC95_000949 [Neochlamydia sp. AcF95]|nr:hypothetical protein [Neochlamydia sp. AcF95]